MLNKISGIFVKSSLNFLINIISSIIENNFANKSFFLIFVDFKCNIHFITKYFIIFIYIMFIIDF